MSNSPQNNKRQRFWSHAKIVRTYSNSEGEEKTEDISFEREEVEQELREEAVASGRTLPRNWRFPNFEAEILRKAYELAQTPVLDSSRAKEEDEAGVYVLIPPHYIEKVELFYKEDRNIIMPLTPPRNSLVVPSGDNPLN